MVRAELRHDVRHVHCCPAVGSRQYIYIGSCVSPAGIPLQIRSRISTPSAVLLLLLSCARSAATGPSHVCNVCLAVLAALTGPTTITALVQSMNGRGEATRQGNQEAGLDDTGGRLLWMRRFDKQGLGGRHHELPVSFPTPVKTYGVEVAATPLALTVVHLTSDIHAP